MISVLVSDLGKVLLPFDYEVSWRAILPFCDLGAAARTTFGQAYRESGLGVGRTDAERFFAQVAPRMGLRMEFAEFCRAWSDMFWEDEEVLALIRAAPVKQRVLLSNTNAIHWDWIRSRHPRVLDPFDRLVLSHECGLEKPALAIYRFVERASGRPASEHLLIDDLRENVEGALAAGWDAIHHTDAGPLRAEFAARGLL